LSSHEETRRQFNGGYSGTAKDSRDYVYVGAVLEREFNEWLTLGAELFGNSPNTQAKDFSAIYDYLTAIHESPAPAKPRLH